VRVRAVAQEPSHDGRSLSYLGYSVISSA
jgi:hypothetical protein